MKHITGAVTGVVIAMLTSVSYAESVADKRGPHAGGRQESHCSDSG